MKKILISMLSLLLAVTMCFGCNQSTPQNGTESTPQNGAASSPIAPGSSGGDPTVDQPPKDEPLKLNGVDIAEYTIVYDDKCLDYTTRAVEYINNAILAKTGATLETAADNAGKGTFDHEIVVGETNRQISADLNVDTEGVTFSMLAKDGHIAMEADYFAIAAAAYYFVETYINGDETAVPETATVLEPIVEEAKNFIFLIGDGMGTYQTRLFESMKATSFTDYSDGEDLFYGYMFPNFGLARTDSLSGVTDSAAAGTALATGYKTINGYVGRDSKKNDILSLTEIAGSLGKATAVMSTEGRTGATPSSFSAHANDRNDSSSIISTQQALVNKYNTTIRCDFNVYSSFTMYMLENAINSTLKTVSEDEDGFFLMYEEAHIDKHCHSQDMINTFMAVVRFNQAIGMFMEYAFYNPDTFVLITADHETGGLLPNGSGGFKYSHGNHSPQYVPVFTYGIGGELFNGKVIENIQIPKTIAAFWNYEIKGEDGGKYPSLKKLTK